MTQPYQLTIGGQAAWFHDDGHAAGVMHTYDGLQVAGPNDTPRKVHVFIPRDYAANRDGYPVVYMNDGETAFYPGGVSNKCWHVEEALDALYQKGSIGKVLVVAMFPLDRELEYTHTDWAPGRPYGGLEGYTGYVAEAVKGFIDRSYKTKPGPATTAIIGSSHGGLASFYMAGRRPDVFGMAGCLSSSFWVGLDPIDGGPYTSGPLASSLLIDEVKSTLSREAGSRPKLWIDWGLVRTGGSWNAVMEAANTTRGREMVDLLQKTYGYRADELAFYEDPQGQHDEDSWTRRFPMMMNHFYGAR